MSALRLNAANAAKCSKTLKQRETLLSLRSGLAVGTMSCHFKLNLIWPKRPCWICIAKILTHKFGFVR